MQFWVTNIFVNWTQPYLPWLVGVAEHEFSVLIWSFVQFLEETILGGMTTTLPLLQWGVGGMAKIEFFMYI